MQVAVLTADAYRHALVARGASVAEVGFPADAWEVLLSPNCEESRHGMCCYSSSSAGSSATCTMFKCG